MPSPVPVLWRKAPFALLGVKRFAEQNLEPGGLCLPGFVKIRGPWRALARWGRTGGTTRRLSVTSATRSKAEQHLERPEAIRGALLSWPGGGLSPMQKIVEKRPNPLKNRECQGRMAQMESPDDRFAGVPWWTKGRTPCYDAGNLTTGGHRQ